MRFNRLRPLLLRRPYSPISYPAPWLLPAETGSNHPLLHEEGHFCSHVERGRRVRRSNSDRAAFGGRLGCHVHA